MSKVKELTHQATGTKITFCYGEKVYTKYVKKEFDYYEEIKADGVTTTFINNKTDEFAIVVGVKKFKDIYALKGLVVHELSHVVSLLMKEFDFDCDEFRSYTLQWLYLEVMVFLDGLIGSKND